MRNILQKIGYVIRTAIDFFYPPFKKIVPLQFFRYGIVGITNVGCSWVLFGFVYNLILHQQPITIYHSTFSSHSTALFITFPFANFFGFLLQKYVTFPDSNLRGNIQLFRYFVVVFINLGINYVVLNLLVLEFQFWAVPSYMIATVICIIVSYISQRKYTFRKKTI